MPVLNKKATILMCHLHMTSRLSVVESGMQFPDLVTKWVVRTKHTFLEKASLDTLWFNDKPGKM